MNGVNCRPVLVSLDTKQREGCLKATEKVNFNIINELIHDCTNIWTYLNTPALPSNDIKTGHTDKTLMSPHLPYLASWSTQG